MRDTSVATHIRNAMKDLENMPCGAIGNGGPTIEDLDASCGEGGDGWWEDDAMYHQAQHAWRNLELALREIDR
jgi:hypothetical protein